MPVVKKSYPTTIEVDNFTRDDITRLAKLEAKKIGMRKVSNKEYITLLINREKAKAVASGDLR